MRQNSPCFIVVASSIYGSDPDTNLLMLWARQRGASPYRPPRAFSSRNVLIAILLLSSGNVESNPGPPSRTTSNKTKLPTFINFGHLNVRSAIHKAASIYDIIKDFSMDIFRYRKVGLALTPRQPYRTISRRQDIPVYTSVVSRMVVVLDLFTVMTSSLNSSL